MSKPVLSMTARRELGRRIKAAAAARKAQGGAVSGPSVARDRPELAAVIWAMREAGDTYQRIADVLNLANVPTMRGGTMWRVSSVQASATSGPMP